MKLNRKTLRRMILAEIKILQEDRQDYAIGLANKIARLEAELSREQKVDRDMAASDARSDILRNKIDQLKRRLADLNVMPQARLGTSGIRMLDL